MKKTYAARGMIDWQLALNVGGAVIRICFTDGSMGSNGVIPARYTTESPAIQRMIEDSQYYKDGRIIYYPVVPDPKDLHDTISNLP